MAGKIIRISDKAPMTDDGHSYSDKADRVRRFVRVQSATSSPSKRASMTQRPRAPAAVGANARVDLKRRIRIKSLPNGDLLLRLANEFGWRINPLSQLARLLTEDRQRSFISQTVMQGRQSFVVSTPRLRVRFFPDARDETSVIVISVEANSPERWYTDKRFALACHFEWTSELRGAGLHRDDLLEPVRAFTAGHADAESFWEFWSEYLSKEKEQAKSKREHPGWSYSQRQFGLDGCINFDVADSQPDILGNCSGRILVQTDRKDDKNRVSYLRFEVRKPVGTQWIAAFPLQATRLDQVPKDGFIKVDWISVESERKRREDALHRLRLGKTAMSNLNTFLPSGRNVSGESVSFIPLLDKNYNDEQNKAIAKALSENTITAILGPPGTGKTSVIAEIASQIASRGQRVLISSQSNLAVDNALERGLDSDRIFRLRVGRPESVKFNTDLLRERASDRYRRMLLDKSTRAFQGLDTELRSISVNSVEEVELLHARIDQFIDARETHKHMSDRAAFARETRDRSNAHLESCEATLEKSLKAEGLTAAELPSFLICVSELESSSINPVRVFERREQIDLAQNRCQDLQVIESSLSAEQACEQKLETATKRVRDLENRISASVEKEKELCRLQAHNSSVEHKRRTAGLWTKLASFLTNMLHDLEPLRREIERLNATEAKAHLPDAMREKEQATAALAQARRTREETSQQLFRHSSNLNQLKQIVKELKSDLAIADLLRRAGGLAYATNMRSATIISQGWYKLQCAVQENQVSTQRASTTEANLDNIGRTMLDLLPSVKELSDRCQSLGIPVPLSLRNASEDVLLSVADKCWAASTRLRARKEKWGHISAAVSAYQSRLSEEAVDLSKAVISEANVVGATCSGIAGSTDFAEDFDWVIIDEAGRATPLDLLMAMVRGRSIVLVGDHKQLPPFLNQEVEKELANDLAEEGAGSDYQLTLFEHLFGGMPATRKEALKKQYRMVDAICDVVREISYRELAIETAGAALTRKHPFKNLSPIHWIQCEGKKNRAESIGYGLRNFAEVDAIQQFLDRLIPVVESDEFKLFLEKCKQGNPYEIGIIAMYRQQALALESAVFREQFSKDRIAIEVGTVDAFQGREKDAVIVSFVETNPNKLRFFYDRKRLNVALSRARELLVIVGGLDVLGRRATVVAGGRHVPNPLNELKFLFDACAAANNATREIHHAD
jgi:molybdopterin-guanine dinucleotide biosynthesis protein